MNIAELLSSMKYAEIWSKNEFAAILADSNKKVGNQISFAKLLYDAVNVGTLKTINTPYNLSSNPEQRNYLFNPQVLKNWALSKNFTLPKSLVKQSKSIEPLQKPVIQSNIADKHNGEIAEMNSNRALAIMALLLSENKPAMMINGRPNCTEIAKRVSVLAEKHFGNDVRGFKSFNKKLSKALKELDASNSTVKN